MADGGRAHGRLPVTAGGWGEDRGVVVTGYAGNGSTQRGPPSLTGHCGRADDAEAVAPTGASTGGLVSGAGGGDLSVRGSVDPSVGGTLSSPGGLGGLGLGTHCRKTCVLVRSGLVHQHGTWGKPCPGMGQLPVRGSRRPAPPGVDPRDASTSASSGNLSTSSQPSQDLFRFLPSIPICG